VAEHKRKSIRLPYFDYSQDGIYFVTICSHDNKSIFGKIENEKMIKNLLGEIIENEWEKTISLRKNVSLGSFIVMPNHFRGIIIINSKLESRGVLQYAPTQNTIREFTSTSNSLGAIIRGFKGAVTKRINLMNNTEDKIWQRNYYERVIRNDKEYNKIDEYIRRNVELWKQDKYY
jgi:REP element-mobilizing transposase RayT